MNDTVSLATKYIVIEHGVDTLFSQKAGLGDHIHSTIERGAQIIMCPSSKIDYCLQKVSNLLFFLYRVHPKLRSITLVATKVHVILRSFVVLTWMRDTTEPV